MILIKFTIHIFYKTDEALENFVGRLLLFNMYGNLQKLRANKNNRLYETDHVIIHCTRGISPSARGYKAHLIAVQEELTWQEQWPEIRDCVLKPMIMSPFDIQIFDGITYEDAKNQEEARVKI